MELPIETIDHILGKSMLAKDSRMNNAATLICTDSSRHMLHVVAAS